MVKMFDGLQDQKRTSTFGNKEKPSPKKITLWGGGWRRGGSKGTQNDVSRAGTGQCGQKRPFFIKK